MVTRDERLIDNPLLPADCRQCAARVLARTSGNDQTVIQWDRTASRLCRLASATADHKLGRPSVCPAIRESIRAAASSGTVPVVLEQ